MEQLISNVVSGMSYGSVYALLAVGLVLAYKTSGIFNLAYGAQAFVSGADISKFESERASEEAVARYNEAVERANSRTSPWAAATESPMLGSRVG